MPADKRYLITVLDEARREAGLSLQDIMARMPEDRVVRRGKSGTHVVKLTSQEADALAREHPGILIEEDQELELLFPMPGNGFRLSDTAGHDLSFHVIDAADKKPLAGVTVFIRGAQATYESITGKDGKATVRAFESSLNRVIVSPAANYWSRVVEVPAGGATVTVPLERLSPPGSSAWSRGFLGLTAEFPFGGAGVKVAILDSGIAEHPDLVVAGGFNALDGENPKDFRRDEKGHGTHCAGILAGRNAASGVLGVAPDAAIYSVKVFPGGRLSDLLEGVQWCIENGMDVINMSLGMANPSPLLANKLAEATGMGITLVAAAGNDGGAVRYPAAIDGVIAVTALGSSESFPTNSAHALRISELLNPENGLFVANFSNSGPQTAFIAPGVAIVSSVPAGHAAWDGSSMACAFISGFAALALSAYPELKTGGAQQSLAIREVLASGAVDLSLPVTVQGDGVPQAGQAFAMPVRRHQAGKQLGIARQAHLERFPPLIADLEQKQREIRELLAQVG